MELRFLLYPLLALVLGIGACEPIPPTPPAETARYTYSIVNTYPHDPEAFTQGLVFAGAGFIEGTGLEGASTLRRVVLETGEVVQRVELASTYFGEGVTLLGDRIYQLTWRDQVGFIYDRDTFEQTGTFSYDGEGWGLTHDGERLIMSDGTAWLRFLDPDSLAETGRIEVHGDAGPVSRLNELEYIDGQVFANVWRTDHIVVIDPATGQVVSWVDLAGLLPAEERTIRTDVLNGIAYDAHGERIFVTGKRWPFVYEIALVPANDSTPPYANPESK